MTRTAPLPARPITPITEHVCPANGCTADVLPKRFFCDKHWAMVSPGLQKAMLDHFVSHGNFAGEMFERAIRQVGGAEFHAQTSAPWKDGS